MKLRLDIHFNNIGVAPSFSIVNPPTVPQEGELFYANWEDFIPDKEAVKRLKELDDVFRVEIMSRRYSKDLARVMIMLHEETAYERDVLGK